MVAFLFLEMRRANGRRCHCQRSRLARNFKRCENYLTPVQQVRKHFHAKKILRDQPQADSRRAELWQPT